MINENEPANDSEHALDVRLGLGDGSEQVRVREQVLNVSHYRCRSMESCIEWVQRQVQKK